MRKLLTAPIRARDLSLAWRLLEQDAAWSGVVIGALSLGFAVCFLLLGLVRHALSYDAQVPALARVYLVKNEFNLFQRDGQRYGGSALAMRDDALGGNLAEAAVRYVPLPISMRTEQAAHNIALCAVDPDFQTMLGVVVLHGDLKAALTHPYQLALTRHSAQLLFGREDVVEQTLYMGDRPFQVAAVLADPGPTTLPYAALTGLSTAIWSEEDRRNALDNWWASDGKLLIRLAPGTTPAAMTKRLQLAADASTMFNQLPPQMVSDLSERKLMDVHLIALRDAYFEQGSGADGTPRGERAVVFALAALAGLIMLLATSGYVNLATVRTLRRRREIGIRKVLGASVLRVAGQFLAESLLVSMLATCTGLLLAWLLLPWFEQLAERRLDAMFAPTACLTGALLGLCAGLGASVYPIRVALRVRAAVALAGRGAQDVPGSLTLRRTLTVLQLAGAMGLTAVTLTVAWQTRYTISLSAGVGADQLLFVELPEDLRTPFSLAIQAELAHWPGVDGIAASGGAPGAREGRRSALFKWGANAPVPLELADVSANFFTLFRVHALTGKLFDELPVAARGANAVVLNASAARALGFKTPHSALGQTLRQTDRDTHLSVVGIVPDIGLHTLRTDAHPVAYRMSERATVLTLRMGVDAIDRIERALPSIWARHFPDQVANFYRAPAMVLRQHAQETRLTSLLTWASATALVIAAFGIYVLSAHTVQRRADEIALHKLCGATATDIAVLLGREFAVLIAVAAALALPLAALVAEHYLNGFAARAPIGPWALLAALVGTASVASAALLRHMAQAMRMAPLQVLRG